VPPGGAAIGVSEDRLVSVVTVSVATADGSVVDATLEQAARADARRTRTRVRSVVFLFMIFPFFPISGWYGENGLVERLTMVWFIVLIIEWVPVKRLKRNCELPERIPILALQELDIANWMSMSSTVRPAWN
jgi:hypothetical protein